VTTDSSFPCFLPTSPASPFYWRLGPPEGQVERRSIANDWPSGVRLIGDAIERAYDLAWRRAGATLRR
jgi:hypothetical protein